MAGERTELAAHLVTSGSEGELGGGQADWLRAELASEVRPFSARLPNETMVFARRPAVIGPIGPNGGPEWTGPC